MRPGGIAHYCAPYLGALCLLNPPLGRAAGTSAAQARHPERWPRLKPALPRDPDLESRIEALVARMTSAQKVGQLIQADIDSITPDDLAHDPLGSVLNGGNSSPMAISSLHRVSGSRWPTGSMTFRSGQGAPPGSPSCGVPTRCTATTTSPAPRSSRITSAPARRVRAPRIEAVARQPTDSGEGRGRQREPRASARGGRAGAGGSVGGRLESFLSLSARLGQAGVLLRAPT